MNDNTRMALRKMDIEFRNRELEFRKRNSHLNIIKDTYLSRLSAVTNLTTMDKVGPLLKPPSCLEDAM